MGPRDQSDIYPFNLLDLARAAAWAPPNLPLFGPPVSVPIDAPLAASAPAWLLPLQEFQRVAGTLSPTLPDPASPDDRATSLWTSNASSAPGAPAAAGQYAGAAASNPYLGSSAGGGALDPARTLRLLERAKRAHDFVAWMSGGPGVRPDQSMPYGATAADASRPGTPTAGIDDAVDQPAPSPFDRPPTSSPPWLPLLAATPQAQATPQDSAPSAPAQLLAAPRRPHGTYWSLLSPSGALLPATNPIYRQPRTIDNIQPTPAPTPDVRQQSGTHASPGEQAQSNYWQATHGVDTAPMTTPADNSPWATVWQHTPVLGRILQIGDDFGYGFRAGQVPRTASPQATYRAAQAGDESYMPSFERTGPSLRDVVTGFPSGLADTARMAMTPPAPLPKGAYLRDDGAVQGAADPQEWRAWVTEMRRRAELGPSIALQMLGVGTFAKPGAASLVAAPPLVPEGGGDLMLPPRLPNRPVEPFAPWPADLPDVDLAALEARAHEIHAVLDSSWAQTRRTTAVLSTNEKTIVGGGRRDLDPKQRDLLRDDEVLAKLPGAHAELTVLWKALARGYTARALATSRPICRGCRRLIEAFGGKVISPTLAIFPTR